MSGFMKTMLKTACTEIAGMFLGNWSGSVHVVLRVLSTLCTLNRSYTMSMQAFEIAANESNEPNKTKLELKLIIWFAALIKTCLTSVISAKWPYYVFTVR